MNKHTPIPWKIDPQDRGVIIDSKNRDIAVMSIHTAMKNRSIESLDEKILEANAHRICHCVNTHDELLEACRTAIRGFKTAAFRDPDQAGLYDAYEKPIRTAIAKATGE